MNDPFPVSVQMKKIVKLFDKAHIDELLESHLGKSVNIQGIPAYELGECLDLFCGAVRIGTIKTLRFIESSDLGGCSANGTSGRDSQITALREILCDLRNDHIGFIYRYAISYTEL